jgi:3-keto-5-aminohexanoate cleavage enzyme
MMVDMLPKNSIFCVSGIGPSQLEANINALLLGGHARVGLEDNLYFRHGELATNIQLTERIVRIMHDMDLEPATAAEARAMRTCRVRAHLGRNLRGIRLRFADTC